MSSDGYFDDDLDSAFLNEVDVIEAAYLSPKKYSLPEANQRINVPHDSDDFGLSMTFNDDELEQLDTFIEDSYRGKATPIPGPSRLKQTTLWGQEPPETISGRPKPASKPVSRTTSAGSKAHFGKQARKTKEWDRTAFAKSGWKKATKCKGKAGLGQGDEEENEEEVEFEQFPAPFISIHSRPPPMKLTADRMSIQHWIYPLNQDKRDYQFNIVKHCLFDNTLVALPTGLGKTFIAGVVMLNFYRWFPSGKVVFVAPTKPLVAQQIEACHRTCGIPGSDAAELTGEVTRAARNRAWEEKRVFYMTPQTLINDLSQENCDPASIILLVVDEAHKGKGDYAYAQVVRFMMAKNPHFRLLALTATPGSKPEAVQEIVDSLHISHIEIRDEESLDLRQYMFKKNLELHVIKMDNDIVKVRDLLAKIMDPLLRKVQGSGLLQGSIEVTLLHPFRCQALLGEASARRNLAWVLGPLSLLASLARSMGYLIEASMGMCYDSLVTLVEGDAQATSTTKSGKKAKRNTKFGNDSGYQAVMKELESQKRRPGGFPVHPKMEKLKMLIIQHFASKTSEPGQVDNIEGETVDCTDDTRVMVFVTFRNCVEEIVEFLNQDRPLIKATKFIGQSTDKDGNRGFAQKDQLDVIRRFKAGEFNVLVSTSIGEEGLDIGSIDLIVCYDAQKTPIRMLQRVGRTGRKREGHVHVLLSEAREENNWAKAQNSYQEVQHSIVRGDQLELYADVERLIPEDVKPECKEMIMEIEEYVRGKSKAKTSGALSKSITKKRKRNDDIGRNIPGGASTGFVSVKDLITKGASKKRKKNTNRVLDEHGLDSDDTDRDIEAGITGPRRTVSDSAATPAKSKTRKAPPKRATTHIDEPIRKPKKAPLAPITRLEDLTSSQFDQMGKDDSDDIEIERGLQLSPVKPGPSIARSRGLSSSDVSLAQDVIELSSPSPEPLASSPDRSLSFSISTGCRSNSGLNEASQARPKVVSRTPTGSPRRSTPRTPSSSKSDVDVAWLVDDDEDPDMTIEIVTSSPQLGLEPFEKEPPTIDMEDNEVELVEDKFSIIRRSDGPQHRRSSDEVEVVDMLPRSRVSPRIRLGPSRTMDSSDRLSSLSPKVPKRLRNLMPPPPVPLHLASNISVPEPSFPVRPAGKQMHNRLAAPETLDSSPLAMPPPSQRRLKRHRSSSPSPPRPPTRKKGKLAKDVLKGGKRWMDTEATHSGDEVSTGSSAEGEPESESDRQFLKDIPDTQVSPSYNQTVAYRQSLMSQAPRGAQVPVFSRALVRNHPFGVERDPRPRTSMASSSPREDEGPDEYAFGSFVVDDDAEISFLNSSSEI